MTRGTNAASPTKRRRMLATTAVIAGAAVALPASAFAALDDNGGAARNTTDRTQEVRAAVDGGPAQNVILLIGDGMGDSEITIARNYAYGAAGRFPGIDALPLTGQYTTYSLYRDGPNKGKPDYAPDSSATGSAWATGTKTYDNAVSVDVDGVPQATLIELAKANGFKTGNVSTAEIQDATPAVQVAHTDERSCYGPDSPTCGNDALEAGGLGSISEQLIGTRADVTLGGGATTFAQTAKAGAYEGQTLFEQAEARGYQIVDDEAGLAGIRRADQTAPVLGLFTPGNFPTRYASTTPTLGGTDAPVTCQPNPERLSPELSLASLTNKAISLLDTRGSKGFFLQVEGASIDKRDHAADACGQIGETVDLDEAVRAALDFAERDRNTLVLVTADHAHSSQIVDEAPATALSTALTTVDDTVMTISYGNAPAAGESQQHTGTQLRVAGYGPGAANIVGLTDQTDTFFTMANALKLDRDATALSARAKASSSDNRPRPNEQFTVTGTRFAGDRQVVATQQPGGAELGTFDVIDGTVTVGVRAPRTAGEFTVTLTGAQTGKTATVTVRVR